MAEYTDRYDVGSLESTERQYSDFQLIKRIITDYTLEYRSIFLLVTTLVFVKMLLVIASPYLLRVTIDYYINNKPPVEFDPIAGFIEYTARMLTGLSTPNFEVLLMSAAILFVIISILQWVVNSLQTYYIEKLGLLVIADIRGDFFSHLGQLSQSFFEHGNTGKLGRYLNGSSNPAADGLHGSSADPYSPDYRPFTGWCKPRLPRVD